MDRHLTSNGSDTAPAVPTNPLGANVYPKSGASPSTMGAWWYHMVTESMRNVIVGSGKVPDRTDPTLLLQAIQSMIVGAQTAVVVNGAAFEASVANGEAVRWDAANTRYDEAVADGTANNRAVGFADVTNGKVYLYGECPLFSGLTPGARYYLDATTPGAITATAPADSIMVGIAKSATTLFVDIDAAVADLVNQVNTWNKGQRAAETPLVDGANIPVDMNASNDFAVTLGGNRTLDNPTNMVVGQSGCIRVTHGGTYTLAFGSYYQAAGGIANLPAVGGAGGTVDEIYYRVSSATSLTISNARNVS